MVLQTGDVFAGFKFDDANVQFDDKLLLIEPEVADRSSEPIC